MDSASSVLARYGVAVVLIAVVQAAPGFRRGGLSAREQAANRSPVIINEIHYHPPGEAGLDEEFVELHNRTGASVDLHGWALASGIDFRFDRTTGPTRIAPRGFLLIARNPAVLARVAGLSPTAIAGPYAGKLSNRADRIVLETPDGSEVDVVAYRQDGPWPARADGLGSSLQRRSSEAPGYLPQNWDVVVASRPAPVSRTGRSGARAAPRDDGAAGVLRGLLHRLGGEPSPASPRSTDGAITPGRANAVPAGSVPPLVSFVERRPEQPVSGEAVTIRVRVEGAVPESVELHYDLGAGESAVPLFPERDPSSVAGGRTLYTGEIPPAPDQTVVRFRVTATSGGNATFHLPRHGNPSPYLGYYVLDEPRAASEDLDVYHILWDGPLSCASGRWLAGCTFVHRGTAYLDVGLKYRGLTSCGKPKSGLKVAFNRGDLFRGQKRLNLLGCWQDRSFLREQLAWGLFRDTGHPCCEARMAAVYSHGNRLHGLFVALEEPDERYVRRNGLNPRAVLWKCHTSFLGVENSKSRTYERRTSNEGEPDRTAVLDFEHQLNTLRGAELRSYVLRHLDVESLIEYQAIKALISDEDGYSKNWYLCQEPVDKDDGGSRWTVLPWDMDLSFGQYSLYTDVIRVDRHPLAGTVDHPRQGSHGQRWNGLLEAVFGRESDDYFIKALYGRLWDLLEEKFDPTLLGERIDQLDRNTIEEAREELRHVPRWGVEGQNVEFHRARLREYVAARYSYLKGFLTTEHPTTASEVGPWEPLPPPRVASGVVPPRALAHRRFRYVPAPRMKIVEIHYHPAQDEAMEFVEIRNLESRDVKVSGWTIPAIGFEFPEGGTVPAGRCFVVARDPAALLARYPELSRAQTRVFGPYPGRLSNRGEDLRLRDNGRDQGRQYYPETIDVVKYRDEAPWPSEADGKGPSLELTDFAGDNDLAGNWAASAEIGGTPGR